MECNQYVSNVSKKVQSDAVYLANAIHIQDTGTEDWLSAPEELVTRGWAFNVFNITNNLDEQTIAIYTFELQGHHHHCHHLFFKASTGLLTMAVFIVDHLGYIRIVIQ